MSRFEKSSGTCASTEPIQARWSGSQPNPVQPEYRRSGFGDVSKAPYVCISLKFNLQSSGGEPTSYCSPVCILTEKPTPTMNDLDVNNVMGFLHYNNK